MSESIYSSAGRPAKPSLSRVFDRDWLILAVTWPSYISAWLTSTGLVGLFGRTSLASCCQAEDGTLVPSSGRWGNSGTGSPTACWTHNTSEFPKDAVASSLSDILETGDVPQQYYLSAKACAGILRRAEARGRSLPLSLRTALESAVQITTKPKQGT